MLNDIKFKANKKELLSISTTSSGSYEIGKIISDAYSKVNNKNSIKITESNDEETQIINKKGYIIDSILASPYFLKDKSNIEISNAIVLIVNNYLNDIEEVSTIINEMIKTKESLVIIAEDYSDLFVSEILNLNMENLINIILLKSPGYGFEKITILDDLALITNSKITETSNISLNKLGKINNITISNNEVIFNFKENEKINKKNEK